MNKSLIVLFLSMLLQFTVNAQEKTLPKYLSLKEALQTGLENNPEIKKAKQLINSFRGKYYRDISPQALNISFSSEFIPKGSSLSNADEKTVEITQTIDFPSVYFAKSSKANTEIKSAENNFEDMKNGMRSKIKRSYFMALAKKMLLDVDEENIKIANEFLKKAEIRYKSGEGTNLELLTAKIQYAEAKSMIETAVKEYKTSLTQLNYSMGSSYIIDSDSIVFTDSLKFSDLKLNLSDVIDKSLNINPFLTKLLFEKESAGISRNISYMSYLPSLNATYMFQGLNGNNNYYGVRFGLNVPLWFMLDQRGQVQESNANFEIANYEYMNAVNFVKSNINSAFIDFQYDSGQVQLYIKELNPQTEDIYKTAFLSYQAGEISYLEFLQAKFTTINTKTNFIKSLFDYKEAIINLEESSGLILE